MVLKLGKSEWRPILDLSPLNKWIVQARFKMLTCQQVLKSLREGDWMVKLDLKDAYLQIPIHPASKPFPILVRGKEVSVQGSSIQSDDRPYGFHEGYGDSCFSTSPVGGEDTSLPGRLADFRSVQAGVLQSQRSDSFSLRRVGYLSQSS